MEGDDVRLLLVADVVLKHSWAGVWLEEVVKDAKIVPLASEKFEHCDSFCSHSLTELLISFSTCAPYSIRSGISRTNDESRAFVCIAETVSLTSDPENS